MKGLRGIPLRLFLSSVAWFLIAIIFFALRLRHERRHRQQWEASSGNPWTVTLANSGITFETAAGPHRYDWNVLVHFEVNRTGFWLITGADSRPFLIPTRAMSAEQRAIVRELLRRHVPGSTESPLPAGSVLI